MKIRTKLLACVFASSLIIFNGCKDKTMLNDDDTNQKQGELVVNLSTDLGEVEVVTSKAPTYRKGENIDEYSILISKDGKPYAGFDKYTDLPENKKIRLFNGDYNFKAYWGVDVDAAFDSPFYLGTKDFAIEGSQTTPIDVVCKLANTKITLIYTESFKVAFASYAAYRTELTTKNTKTPLLFNSKETRNGYFKTSPFVITVFLTKGTGETLFYSFPEISKDVLPGNHYIISLRGKGVGDPEFGMSIEINDVTNNIVNNYDVSLSDLIKAVPTVMPSADALSSYQYVVGQADQTKSIITYVTCEAGLKDVTIKSKADIFSSNGIPDDLSIAALEKDATLAQKVKSIGIEWESETVVGQKGYKVNFNKMLNNLDMLGSEDVKDHLFTVEAIDRFDQKASAEFTIKTQRPLFESPVIAGQLWTDKAYVKTMTQANVTRGDFSKMSPIIYEYSENGTDWIAYTPTDNTTFTMLSDLKPSTQYHWRTRYKQFISDVKLLSTETEGQLPNSGMEDWSGDNIVDSYKRWRVYADSQQPFWGTNNIMTNSEGSDYLYCKNSGTRPTTSVKSGTNAAQIVTVGWGSGNTMVEGSGYVQYKTSPGKLVIGDINSAGEITKGREFTSRPKSLQYWFKHIPYNGRSYRAFVVVEHRGADGTIEIGRSDTYVNGSSVTSYTLSDLAIKYNPAYLDIPATHIYVEFASAQNDSASKADTYKIKGSAGLFAGYKDWRTEGSQLFIDDIKLTY